MSNFMSLREANKAKAKAKIIAAAVALIEQHGAENTTTREIARQAGVSYQTLYNYFPTKALILRELLVDELEAWGTAADALIKQYNGDVLDTLRQINQAALDLMMGPNQAIWQELTSLILHREISGNELFAKASIAHERYHALLALAQGMGHIRKDVDLHLVAHTLFCLSDYAYLRAFLMQDNAGQIMTTLSQQTELVVQPFLTSPQQDMLLEYPQT